MKKFMTQNGDVSAFRVAGEEPVLQKDAINPEANMADVNSRVTNLDTGGGVKDLAQRIVQVYRRTVAGNTGAHALSLTEKRALRDQLVATMTREWDSPFPGDEIPTTEEITAIANRLAELPIDDHIAKSSPAMQDLAQQIERLKELVEKKLGQGANARFVPDRTWS